MLELREWYAEKYGREWLGRVDAAVAGCEAQLRPQQAATE